MNGASSMTGIDKATGAYEPFVQIPPGLDCRGVCPTIEMPAGFRLIAAAMSEWIEAQQIIGRWERGAQSVPK